MQKKPAKLIQVSGLTQLLRRKQAPLDGAGNAHKQQGTSLCSQVLTRPHPPTCSMSCTPCHASSVISTCPPCAESASARARPTLGPL